MKNQTPDHSAVEVFLKSWEVYQDIIRHNYMFHHEIAAAVRSELAESQSQQGLRVLDLGCGDGSMTLSLLPPARILSYLGSDLSKPALDLAHKHANQLGINAKFVCDDMIKVVEEIPANSIDLVFSSYAIHHLNAQKKQQILEGVANLLTVNGQFVLIDIFREPSEDRAAYIRNYMSHLRQTWKNLSAEAQALVINHASEFDFPEHPDFYQVECERQRLPNSKRLAKHTWHEAWIFTR
jgi:ubiquinone/menaquinone biosynthesis C-methylase UbiE